MNVLVTSEHHFDRTDDGRVWTDGQFSYPFWTRYLSEFDAVRVFARVRRLPGHPAGRQPASGPGVSFLDAPDYTGPAQYLLRAARVSAAGAAAAREDGAVILRVPGQLGSCLEKRLRGQQRPYGVEVVGDPYDVFAPGAVRHPLRPLIRFGSTRRLRRQCAGACAAAYVTECALQRRYPPGPDAFATYYSDVELPAALFEKKPRTPQRNGAVRLLFVGSLAQLYKAPDVLIDAVGTGVKEGLDLRLALVGSGRYREALQARAAARGLGERVEFCGQLTTPAAVHAELDRADLFLLPSRVEGLPRAMIEAMACALPCIGSTVGGIPELLPAQDLVPPGDATALARKIREVLTAPGRLAEMSARNQAKAREYAPHALCQRREAFYQSLRIQTERWHEER